jgi:hypothetical protein
MMRFHSLLAAVVLAATPLIFVTGSAAAADPPLVITPNPVEAGQTITFSGAGCLAHGTDPSDTQPLVYLRVDGAGDQGVSPAIKPKADGTWSMELPLPEEIPTIDITFSAVCDGYNWSFNYAPTTLHINGTEQEDLAFMFLPAFQDIWDREPTLRVQKSYEVDGFGFQPGESVVLTVHSTPVKLATFEADEFGEVVGNFELPAGTPSGHHELQLQGVTSKVKTSMAILVANLTQPGPPVTTTTATSGTNVPSNTSSTTNASAPTTTTAGPVLAATGTPATDLTGVGIGLTAAGALTLMLGRRRHRPRAH